MADDSYSAETIRLMGEYWERFHLPPLCPDGGGVSHMTDADAAAALKRALETGRPLPGIS